MTWPTEKKSAVPIVLYALITLFIPAGLLPAQSEDEALFRRGLAEYHQERFIVARDDFRRIIQSPTDSPRKPAAHVMLAKALYRLGEFSEAASVAVTLRQEFPDSPFTEWTYYLESASILRAGDIDRSLNLLAWLAGNARDARLKSRSLRALQHTVLPRADRERADAALKKYGIERSALESAEPYGLAEIFEVEDEAALSLPPATARTEQTSGPVRIGLLAPLSGANAEMGSQLLRGVRASFSGAMAGESPRVELVVEDSMSDPVAAVLKVRKLAEAGVAAIIGPVYSTSNITAAVESNARGIPFVAATATDVGLTDIGRKVFQLNFTPTVQAEALAELAVEKLAVKNVAVIASRDRWGEEVAATFGREVEKKGVNVVLTSFFDSDFESEDDLKIVRDIRAHAPKPPSFVDSTATVLTASLPDTTAADSTYYSSQNLAPLDTVDAILISATPSDAIRFATRIMEFNLITTLIGDSGWNYPNVPDDGRQYVNGAYLVAPPGNLSGGLGPFFMERDLHQDDRDTVAMKGFDAGSLLLNCVRAGARDPESITKALEGVKDFKGASSHLTIDAQRHLNTAVEFVRILDHKYVKAPFTRNTAQ